MSEYFIIGVFLIFRTAFIFIITGFILGYCLHVKDPPSDKRLSPESSKRNSNDQKARSVRDPSVKQISAQGNSPPLPKTPPVELLKPPPFELQKEFKNSHRSVREKSGNKTHAKESSRHRYRQFPHLDNSHQTEFKKSHRSIREKSNRKSTDSSTELGSPTNSQYSTTTRKSSKKSTRSDRKMEKTQRNEKSEHTEEQTDKTEKTVKSTASRKG
ncbi:uncharacterized protein CELE_ZC190.8 [Caenorhabditis elegans]|uniref:Uncharacterized protein n=1 Tax=Caenorhabditis elegans TaxID=6239 RepID=O76705_CAEEL|nr:Uncharacterized protein CELE_ZC190.8 [Caenorhabditis elegans]CCD70120.2 Uncharacterized protein CELE_ZC190.8 [Caenorhabditis elegans]|eukprot:NP_001346710.1 Uncharacterized protein CELE_ZC190.8 [Caenorhabditis elegans]